MINGHLTSTFIVCYSNHMDPNTPQYAAPQQNPPQIQNQPPQLVRPYLDNNSAIIIILLMFLNPVGVLMMWFMGRHWQTWLKTVLTIPLVLTIISSILFFSVFSSFISQNNSSNSTIPSIEEGF